MGAHQLNQRTEQEDRAAGPGEDAPRADVLLLEGILDGGGEETDAAGDHCRVDGALERILGVIHGSLLLAGHRCWTSETFAGESGGCGRVFDVV